MRGTRGLGRDVTGGGRKLEGGEEFRGPEDGMGVLGGESKGELGVGSKNREAEYTAEKPKVGKGEEMESRTFLSDWARWLPFSLLPFGSSAGERDIVTNDGMMSMEQ